jgi:ADP-ribosylarginine hydrolase
MQEKEQQVPDVEERYIASMVLSAVGDALGYKNGSWEFCRKGRAIHNELQSLGGLENLKIEKTNWRVSDDTVMHLATAEALVEWQDTDKKNLYPLLCERYVMCWNDMDGRSPGNQCALAIPYLKQGKWNELPFSSSAGGCGAAMRTACIGLLFDKPNQVNDLLEVSIEASRMTHNHPTGFFGGVVAALFTSYALQRVPIYEWGRRMVNCILPKCVEYLKNNGRNFKEYSQKDHLSFFETKWREYLLKREICRDGENVPKFPSKWDVEERDKFYKSVSFSGWGGSSGHDSVIIAYDALLGCEGNWFELLKRGALHGGDSDSTGSIAGAWFGALYGFKGVPKNHYEQLEYLERLQQVGKELLHANRRRAGL